MNQTQSEIIFQSRQWLKSSQIEKESLTTLTEFVKLITTFFRSEDWLYRGENILFEKPITPSILRGDMDFRNDEYPDKNITDQEIFEIEQCQRKYKDKIISDKYFSAFIPAIHAQDTNWLPLARHFGYRTRLLDVSKNPLVALYFACTDDLTGIDDTNDGYVYIFQSKSFRRIRSDNDNRQVDKSNFPTMPISYLDLYDLDVEFWGR